MKKHKGDGPIGIFVGAHPDSVKAVGEQVLAILACGQEQETIRVALNALTESVSVDNARVSDCVITMNLEEE